MSFGSTQGTVRYAILVDDKASLPIQNINRQFTAMGTQATVLTQKLNSFNTAINTNSRNFTASVNSIKTQGNALVNNTKQLAANTTQVTTLGTKIKDTASKFAGFATGLAVTSAGVLQLAAGFRDYNDAQIAVERVQRKLSLATEAQGKATDKLNALTSKGIKSGKAYEQAQLDVSQANAAVSIQTQLLGEAQERLFDSQTQFAVSIIPTTLGALGTLGSAFKDLSGEKGIGGLTAKFKSFGSSLGGLGGGGNFGGLGTSIDKIGEKLKAAIGPGNGLKASLIGIGATAGVIGLVTAGAIELGNAMNKVASSFSKVKQPVSALEAQIDKSGKSLKTWNLTVEETEAAARAGVSPMMVAFDAVFGTHMTEMILKNAGALDKNGKILVNFGKAAKDVVKPNEDLAKAQDAVNKAMNDPALRSHDKATRDAAQSTLDHAKAELQRQKAMDATSKTTVKLGNDIKVYADNTLHAGQSSGELDDSLKKNAGTFTDVKDVMAPFAGGLKQVAINLGLIAPEVNKSAGVVQGFGKDVDTLAQKFLELNKTVKPVKDQFKEFSMGPVAQAVSQGFDDWGKGATQFGIKVGGVIGPMKGLGAATKVTGKEIQDGLAKAAEEAKRKLDEMASNFDTGLDKIVEAFHKFKKGDKLEFEVNFNKAKEKFDKFLAELGDKMGKGDLKGDEAAKNFVEKFAEKGTKGMSETAQKFFAPILAYAKAHKNDPPEEFVAGLIQVIGESKQKVSDAVDKNFGQPSIKVLAKAGADGGAKASKSIGANLDPKPATSQVKKIQTAINNLHGKTVTITVAAKAGAHTELSGGVNIHLAKGGLIHRMAEGGLIKAQQGQFFTTNGPQLVLAGDNPGGKEDVAFIPQNNPGPTLNTIANRYGGGGSGGNLTVNNVIDLGNDRIIRSFKRKLGQNVYSLGA